MHRQWRHCLFIAMLLGLSAGNGRAAQDLDSRVSAVALYADRAMVTRQATARVAAGSNVLRLAINAFQVDPDSAAARIAGRGSIAGVQLKTIPQNLAPQPQIKALEAQIETQRQALRKLEDRKQGLLKQERFLEGFLDFSRDQIGKELATRLPSAEDLQGTLAFLAASYGEIYSGMQSVDLSLEEVRRELDRLQRELAALQDGAARSRQVLEILFDAAGDQTVTVEADYLVFHASWEPLYRVEVPPELETAQLTLFARIVQKSGENWDDVRMEISNAVPLRGAALPEAQPWWLDMPRPLARAKAAGAALPERVGAAEETAAMADMPAPAPMAEALRRESTLAVSYAPALPVSIVSRDQETLLPLETRAMAGEFYHYAVPKQDPRVFLVCQLEPGAGLLAGALNVYFDGRYLGQTQVEEQTADRPLRLNLGVDREVKVQRRKTTDSLKETYFGKIERDAVIRQIGYRMDIANHKARPVQLQLRDALPIARTDRIQVKDVALTPEPASRNDGERRGVLRWDLKLDPGESQSVMEEFVVIHPKEMALPPF